MAGTLPALLVVVGPTASGKSELALRLAEELGGEIVSADSVQVYRHFDIGSAKPSPTDRARVTHHLIDAVDPFEPMDAARWAELAREVIEQIVVRGRVPIVCGGTFFWVRALLYGLAPAPPGDPVVRARHQQLVAEHGRQWLHAQLARVDPESAARLSPEDLVRVSRALEVYELSGRPLSSWQAQHGFRELRYRALLLGIGWRPEELDQRITARVERMFEAGWVEEVARLLEAGYAEARAMRSVGYRQIAEALSRLGRPDRTQLAEQVVRATRIFARRQRTWLRDRNVLWLSPQEVASVPASRLWERACQFEPQAKAR